MKNLKDTLSTICGIWIAITLGFKTQGIELPPTISRIADIGSVIAIVLLGWLQGKNPNGSTKVIDPATGQQDINPNATKADEIK